MTIRRQYTLPNCNLILEGLSTEGDSASAPMTVLMNVECHLLGIQEKPLSGGREFLESLAAVVNRYAQHLLSGVEPPTSESDVSLVEIKPGEGIYHHLIVRPQTEPMSDDRMEEASPRDIRLTTVQFFDLVDAIDQLVSDSSTLPDLSLPLQPVSRRFVKPAEPVAKRAAPAAIGASALVAAAIALFFVPLPETEPSRPSETSAEDAVETPIEGSETATSLATEPEPDSSEEETAAVDPSSDAATIDPETQLALQEDIQSRIEAVWQPEVLPSEPVSYRVTVSSEGDILDYKYESDAALDYASETPLPELTYLPVDPAEPIDEPVTQFRAVFEPTGNVELAPWNGAAAASPTAETGSASTSSDRADGGNLEGAIATPIDDIEQLRQLNRGLRSTIAEAWSSADLDQDLIYRVRLNGDGEILGYEAVDVVDSAAVPLADLLSNASSDGPQADFKVVFTEAGIIEVSPWDGWPN